MKAISINSMPSTETSVNHVFIPASSARMLLPALNVKISITSPLMVPASHVVWEPIVYNAINRKPHAPVAQLGSNQSKMVVYSFPTTVEMDSKASLKSAMMEIPKMGTDVITIAMLKLGMLVSLKSTKDLMSASNLSHSH